MKYQINQRVKTPIGEGLFQGYYRAVMAATEALLVRLPVNEQTEPHLQDENCITPRAAKVALFAFQPSELGGGVVEALILIAVVAIILLCLGSLLGVPWPW